MDVARIPPCPRPKTLVKKGIPLELLESIIPLPGLRFLPRPRKSLREGVDGPKTDGGADLVVGKPQGGDGEADGNGEGEWEDEAGEGEGGEETEKLGDLEISLHSGGTMSREERKEMMDLLERNMKVMYKASNQGWSRKEKTQELFDKSIHMRFLFARPAPPPAPSTSAPPSIPPQQPLVGFLAFTAVEELEVYTGPDKEVPVIYCYEVQVTPEYQGTGLGAHLMEQMHIATKGLGMRDVRLTVFRCNEGARRLYQRLGYVVHCDDDEDDYVIMRKLV